MEWQNCTWYEDINVAFVFWYHVFTVATETPSAPCCTQQNRKGRVKSRHSKRNLYEINPNLHNVKIKKKKTTNQAAIMTILSPVWVTKVKWVSCCVRLGCCQPWTLYHGKKEGQRWQGDREKYTKQTEKQYMREQRDRQMGAGESVQASESNRELKSQLCKLVLRCSRVVCVRLEEHWLEGACGKRIHAGLHLAVKWFHTSHSQ